jgi:hypothetical protein
MTPRPTPTRSIQRTSIAFALIAASSGVVAQAWTGSLSSGGDLKVDPDTHRAWRVEGNQARPMWDGVHRLDDGSVVIIRDGTAVPNESMLNAWESNVEQTERLADRPCEQLERRVCGPNNECRVSAGCLNARSLLNQEREAQRRAPYTAGAAPETDVTAQCRKALTDAAFPACGGDPGAGVQAQSPCRKLVEQVCGADGRCSESPACAPARQLLGQEESERLAAGRPDAITPSGDQCLEAITNPFFVPCD